MEKDAKKEFIENSLPTIASVLLLHMDFCDYAIKNCKQSSELAKRAKILLHSSKCILILLRELAGMLGGEEAIDSMAKGVVKTLQIEDKEERQRMKELISGYTTVPSKKEETPSMKIKSKGIKS